MTITRWVRLVMVVSAAMTLAACHSSQSVDTAMQGSMNNAANQASTQGLAANQSIQKDADGRIINSLSAPSNQTYYFSFDQSGLSSQDMQAVLAQASYLVNHPNAKVRLEGNADSRGSREYNIGLGWRRDQAVARVLEQQGVAPSQIDMVSFGKEQPAVIGDDESAWSLNRRVHLVYEQTS